MKYIIPFLVLMVVSFSAYTTYGQDKYVTVFAEKFWIDTSAKKILQKTTPSTKTILMAEEQNNLSYDDFQAVMAFRYLADHELLTTEVADVIRKEKRLTKTGVNMFPTKFGEAPTIVMVIWMPFSQKWFVKAENLGLVYSMQGDRIFYGPNVY